MRTTIKVQNLKCGGCEAIILKRLNTLQGIRSISLDIDKGIVSLDHQNRNPLREASKILAQMGYPVDGKHNNLTKRVKSYINCAIGRTIK